jgi:hypothetical protein
MRIEEHCKRILARVSTLEKVFATHIVHRIAVRVTDDREEFPSFEGKRFYG